MNKSYLIRHCHIFVIVILSLASQQALFAQPEADFSANVREGCDFLQVFFADQSIENGSPIVEWEWDLGGSISTLKNPGRLFTTPGSYRVCLTVRDENGQSDTECKDDYIVVYPKPEPAFYAPDTAGCLPFTAEFLDQSTSPNGEIETWIWGLGGSNDVIEQTVPGQDIFSTYDFPDEYTVSLTVIDEKGCVATIVRSNYIITQERAEVYFEASNNNDCQLPLEVDFTNLSSDGDQFEYYWDFGNGQIFNGYDPPTISYDEPGSFPVTLIAENTMTGCLDTFTAEDIVVLGTDPVYFDFESGAGCEPFSITFNPDSIPAGYSIEWDFGDGTLSNDSVASHTYTEPGEYTVSLEIQKPGCPYPAIVEEQVEVFGIEDWDYTATSSDYCNLPVTYHLNFNGQSEVTPTWHVDGASIEGRNASIELNAYGYFPLTLTLLHEEGCTDTIELEPVEVRNFEVEISDPEYGCFELSDTASAWSLDTSEIVDYQWIFEGSNGMDWTSSDATPQIELQDTGLYDLTFIATNELGCTDTIYYPGFYGVGIPVEASFSAVDTSTCLLDPVQFVDESSDAANGWLWDFGDGAVDNDQNPIHEYGDYGIFTVVLTVFNNGCPSKDTLEDYINVYPPVAYFEPAKLCLEDNQPFTVQFINGSAGYDSLIWDFGDGAPVTPLHFEEEPTYTYDEPGVYNVTLWVYNAASGCHHVKRNTVRIYDPGAGLEIDTLEGCAPLTVQFSNLSEDYAVAELHVDGEVIPTPPIWDSLSHTFHEGGVYDSIYIVAYDDAGCRDTFRFPDAILVDQLDPGIQALEDTICAGEQIFLFNNSTAYFGSVSIDFWEVDGLGKLPERSGVLDFTLDRPGSYNVTLGISTPFGCKAVETFPNAIKVLGPELDFESQRVGCTYAEVVFRNKTQGQGLSFEWDFGDGAQSDKKNPRHTYTQPGSYTVTLRSADFAGCSGELSIPQYIEINDPVADFELDDSLGICPPHVVNFTNLSLHGVTYEWDFGDQTGVSVSENPAHVYTEPGVYDVQLIVYRSPGCVDTLFVPEAVIVKGPEGEVEFAADTSCVPSQVAFHALSYEPYFYTWDYGNGELDTISQRITTDSTSYTYNQAGLYYPRLIMADDNNCQRAFQADDPIVVSDIEADFIIPAIENCNLPVTLQPEPLVESLYGGPLVYSWTVTNSETLEEQSYHGGQPILAFEEPGIYVVTLEVSNGYCEEIIEKEVVIGLTPPIPAMQISDQNPCASDTVYLSDNSVAPLSEIVSWNWYVNEQQVSNDPEAGVILAPGETHVIRLEVFNEFGCREEITDSIVVQEDLTAEVSGFSDVCKGGEVTLQALLVDQQPDWTFGWMQNGNVLCSDCDSLTQQLMHGNGFEFFIRNSKGCEERIPLIADTIESGGPEITLAVSEDIICADVPIAVQVQGAGQEDVIDWSTNAGALECQEDCEEITLYPGQNGTVSVVVTNPYGCSSSEEIPVEVIDDRFPFAGPDQTLCEGEELTITLENLENVNWTGPGVNCQNCPELTLQPEGPLDLYVEATTSSGCELQDSVRIDWEPMTYLEAYGDTIVCPGDRVLITGSGATQLYWQPTDYQVSGEGSELVVAPDVDMEYVLRSRETPCHLPDTVSIKVVEKAELFLAGDTVCPGEPAYITYSGLFDEIKWNTGDLPYQRTGPNELMVIPYQSQHITAEAEYVKCARADAETDVVVYDMPSLHHELIYEVYPGESVTVDLGFPDSLYDVVWGPFTENLPCTFCDKFTITPEEELQYQYTVYSPFTGCVDSGVVRITLRSDCDQDLYFVPNAFTPNEDGTNDRLYVYKSPIALDIYSFRIYDRWGNKVFETDDINQGWDGTHAGQMMKPAVFVYVLEVPCILDGSTIYYKGDITLIR